MTHRSKLKIAGCNEIHFQILNPLQVEVLQMHDPPLKWKGYVVLSPEEEEEQRAIKEAKAESEALTPGQLVVVVVVVVKNA